MARQTFLLYGLPLKDESHPYVREDFVTGTDSPVSIDSFTIHVPVSSTASHAIMQPLGGRLMTSPGTTSAESISSKTGASEELKEQSSLDKPFIFARRTSTFKLLLEETISCRDWFCRFVSISETMIDVSEITNIQEA